LKNKPGKKQEWKQMASRASQNMISYQDRIGNTTRSCGKN
jgi:hypothetical protein